MRTNSNIARSSKSLRSSRRFALEARRLGARIRSLRTEQGLTLAEASARMKVDPQHLQKIESGRLNVTLLTLVRIANGLGHPFHALCDPA